MNSIEAVFFDFGGTLFSYREFAGSSGGLIQRLAERLGAPERDGERLGRAYQVCSGEAFRLFAGQRYYLHQDVFREAFRRFALSIDCQPDDAFLDWAHAEMRDWMVASFALRQDCREALAALKEQGLYLSIVSNIDDDFLEPMIERCGLADLLDDWSSSQEAESCKPDSGCFELALRKSGRQPEEVLFVGDSPEHDIAGAKPLGMKTALIFDEGIQPPGQLGGVAESLTRPDHEISSLSQLIPIVHASR